MFIIPPNLLSLPSPSYSSEINDRLYKSITTGLIWQMVLANFLFSLRDINLTLELLPPRRHVVWRDSVGVESSRSGLKSDCADIFQQSFLWLLRHTDKPKRAKQLSMATIPLCFEFFRCHVDVLQS